MIHPRTFCVSNKGNSTKNVKTERINDDDLKLNGANKNDATIKSHNLVQKSTNAGCLQLRVVATTKCGCASSTGGKELCFEIANVGTEMYDKFRRK